jgi:hypothetical protein
MYADGSSLFSFTYIVGCAAWFCPNVFVDGDGFKEQPIIVSSQLKIHTNEKVFGRKQETPSK